MQIYHRDTPQKILARTPQSPRKDYKNEAKIFGKNLASKIN
jgi:hypothetical protein